MREPKGFLLLRTVFRHRQKAYHEAPSGKGGQPVPMVDVARFAGAVQQLALAAAAAGGQSAGSSVQQFQASVRKVQVSLVRSNAAARKELSASQKA